MFELPIPPLVITDPKSEAGEQLVVLHERAVEATRILRACEQAWRDATGAISVCQEALAAELDRGAQKGTQNRPLEVKLARAIEDAKIAADPVLHEPRIDAAATKQNAAVNEVRGHTQRFVADLLEELRPEAERVTAELAEAREKLVPFLNAYGEIAARVAILTESVHRGRKAPQDYGFGSTIEITHRERWTHPPRDTEVPFPDQATVEEWDRSIHPERYQVPEPECDGVRDNALSVALH
jgi:hypothetical protein